MRMKVFGKHFILKKPRYFILKHSKTLVIARTALICALYVALTYALGSLAYGPIQIRIGEGMTMLPLLYSESVFGLYLGCILANVFSGYGAYDIGLGSLATLLAAVVTFLIGKFVKNKPLKIILGGLPPVLFNAFIIPAVMILAGADEAYVPTMLSIMASQSIFVYAVGTPLYLLFDKLSEKGVKGFEVVPLFAKKKKEETPQERTSAPESTEKTSDENKQ